MTAGQSAPSIWMRPERSAVGRPAQRSRAEITCAAVGIADREGLDTVSMRRVAAELGTGAASLYRYVETRDELLDLMIDAVGGEHQLPGPSGDWLADLVAIGEQSRTILRRHPWLPGLVIARPVIGPNGIALLEHVLAVLERHPADVATKLEAFAMLNGVTAAFVQYELGGGAALQERNVAYLQHAVSSGEHPRLAELLSQGPPAPAEGGHPAGDGVCADGGVPADPVGRYAHLITRVLSGLLGPAPGAA
ncbi:MAG: TetR/AcrR family transcriptional regulator [Streptosporangiaceae bacterium]|nr:TetR/AcrR family transcriptional regulator [Streptosporangiaceae bacterium]MBV9853558.1 TetR/AcrR family transcriptional regulator [Streptosporangiaceae bacterium]